MNSNHFAKRWIESWNNHNLEEILSHYSEEIEFFSPFIQKLLNEPTGKIKGKKALKKYFQIGLEKYPDLEFKLLETYSGVSTLVIRYQSVNQLIAAETFIFDADEKVKTVYAHYSH